MQEKGADGGAGCTPEAKEDIMLDRIPDKEQMTALVGESLYEIWNQLCAFIDENYDMDRLWNKGGKAWTYEYKYRRGGKTLCALYARENCVGFMIILGKDERLKFEKDRENYGVRQFFCILGIAVFMSISQMADTFCAESTESVFKWGERKDELYTQSVSENEE